MARARAAVYTRFRENLYLVGAIPGKFTPSNLLGTHVRKQGILTLRLQYIPRILRVLKYLRACTSIQRATVTDTRGKKKITEIEYIDFLDAPRSLLAPGFQMWPRHP